MPRIVSGFDPQGNMTAFLAGRQEDMRRKQMQQAAQQAESQRHMAMIEQVQRATASHKNEQAKALADANKRAQMGDAQAMEQQNMEARAQGAPPEQKRLQEMSGILSKITDPQARDDARREFMGYEKQLRDEEQKQAINRTLEKGVKDGVITPEEVQSMNTLGKGDELAKEVVVRKQKQIQSAVALEQNSKALEQARTTYETIEDEDDRAMALKAIVALETSPSDQEDPNSGKVLNDFLRRLAAKKEAMKAKAEKEAFMKDAGKEPWLGGYGVFGGPSGPENTPSTGHKTLQGAQKIRSAIGSALQETRDPAEIMQRLQEGGVPLTVQVQRLLKEALQGGAAEAAQP